MTNDYGQYYRRRMEAELEAADLAEDSSVAGIHRAMAERYRQLLFEYGSGAWVPPPGAADPVSPELPAE